MPNYGPNVSRTLPVGETAYTGTVHLKLKPSIDAEHNLDTDLADFNSAQRLRVQMFSGVTNIRAAGLDKVFVPTLDPNFISSFGKYSNEFAIQNFDAVVNGWVIPVRSSRVNGGNYNDLNYLSIELPDAPAPSPMFRHDFLFLEVWRALIKPPSSTENKPDATHVWKFGNTQFGGVNLTDDLIQPDINALTSYRVQVQYRLRIVTGVNFDSHPDGLTDPIVKGQGGSTTPSTAWGFSPDPLDKGLYVAGDGSASAISDLGTVDGRVFAIPVCKVHRRNTAPYSLSNPNGSATDINDPVSDRPDGLFQDEVSLRDIIDLRHTTKTDMSMSDILEQNFDALLRRDLFTDFGKDPTISSQIQGTEMLTVDGYSLDDQTNVYDLPFNPDGLRRDYSGEERQHTVLYTFNSGADVTTGPVLYEDSTREIQINLSGGVIVGSPLIYTDGVLRPDGIEAPGWTGTGAIRIGILNTLYLSQNVTISIQAKYNSAGHRFVATRYYKVRNARSLNPEDWAFTVNPTSFTQVREVPETGLPSVLTVSDKVYDYPIVTVLPDGTVTYPTAATFSPLSYQSYTRTYEKHMTGNNTNQYVIPSNVNGSPVYGIISVKQSDSSPILFNQVEPNSVTRNIDGTYTVILPSAYATTKIIKFELALGKTSTVLDRSTKGLKEIMYLEWVSQEAPSTTTTFYFNVSNIPYGMSSYNKAGTPKFFAYVDGLRVDINEADVDLSLNKITITFDSAITAGKNILFYCLTAYAPKVDDRLQITYDRLAYQGVGGEAPMLHGARIVAVGKKPLLHSIGTYRDTDLRNKEMFAISEILPLALNYADSDLTNDNLGLANSQFSSFKMLRMPNQVTHDYRSGSTGKLPEVGDIILLEDELIEPTRGIKNKRLVLRNRLEDMDYPMEYISPLLTDSNPHQVVTYYLVQTVQTRELLMLVVTYTADSLGGDIVKSSVGEDGVAYDLFKIHGKPILK